MILILQNFSEGSNEIFHLDNHLRSIFQQDENWIKAPAKS